MGSFITRQSLRYQTLKLWTYWIKPPGTLDPKPHSVGGRPYSENFTSPVGGDIAASLQELIAAGRKYRAILADTPWRVWTDTNKRGGSDRYYHSLPTAEIEALPVAAVADERAFLFLSAPAGLLTRCAVGDVGMGLQLYHQYDMVQGWRVRCRLLFPHAT